MELEEKKGKCAKCGSEIIDKLCSGCGHPEDKCHCFTGKKTLNI